MEDMTEITCSTSAEKIEIHTTFQLHHFQGRENFKDLESEMQK
jgi:hypothetical protein